MPLTGILEGAEGRTAEESDEEEDAEEEGEEGEEGEGNEEGAVGPSVFVPGTFVPPEEDIKLLDARRLVVHGKAQDDSEADRAASTVSAFARVHNTKVCMCV